ncbi:MAG: hypothetical protein HY805_01130 [Nitrospirae bacterium]|nr:hypothetical protein [Nitrospirota bacterium]
MKKFMKIMEKNKRLVKNLDFRAKAEVLGIPKCPNCNAPLLAGFGDSSGDYYQCLNCEATIPVDKIDGRIE